MAKRKENMSESKNEKNALIGGRSWYIKLFFATYKFAKVFIKNDSIYRT